MAVARVKICKKEGCDSVFESQPLSNKVYCSDECRYTYNQVGSRVGDNKGAHGLSEIDEVAKTGKCNTCGPVKVRRRINKGKYATTYMWRCYTRERALQWARLYGVSADFIIGLLHEQGGSCAICNKSIIDKVYVDHDHNTGRVRGLLCNGCNTGIGLLKDSPEVLDRAAEYLRKYQ